MPELKNDQEAHLAFTYLWLRGIFVVFEVILLTFLYLYIDSYSSITSSPFDYHARIDNYLVGYVLLESNAIIANILLIRKARPRPVWLFILNSFNLFYLFAGIIVIPYIFLSTAFYYSLMLGIGFVPILYAHSLLSFQTPKKDKFPLQLWMYRIVLMLGEIAILIIFPFWWGEFVDYTIHGFNSYSTSYPPFPDYPFGYALPPILNNGQINYILLFLFGFPLQVVLPTLFIIVSSLKTRKAIHRGTKIPEVAKWYAKLGFLIFYISAFAMFLLAGSFNKIPVNFWLLLPLGICHGLITFEFPKLYAKDFLGEFKISPNASNQREIPQEIVTKVRLLNTQEENPLIKNEDINISRGYEFYGGQIRFKIRIESISKSVLTNLKLVMDLPEPLLWIGHEPPYPRRGDAVLISRLGAGEKKTLSLYLEPINCMTSPVNAVLSYSDSRDQTHALTMHPLTIEVSCPLFFTPEDANLARIKNIRGQLQRVDRKIFPITRPENSTRIFALALGEVGKHDIKLVFKEYNSSKQAGEAWFYGITKLREQQMTIHLVLDEKNQTLEVEAAGSEASTTTALLAEIENQIRLVLRQEQLLLSQEKFLDIRTSLALNECPYCSAPLAQELVDAGKAGKSFICKYCDSTIIGPLPDVDVSKMTN